MTIRAVAWDVDDTLVVACDHLGERITDADYVIRDLSSLPSLIGAHRPATMPVELHGTGGV